MVIWYIYIYILLKKSSKFSQMYNKYLMFDLHKFSDSIIRLKFIENSEAIATLSV